MPGIQLAKPVVDQDKYNFLQLTAKICFQKLIYVGEELTKVV